MQETAWRYEDRTDMQTTWWRPIDYYLIGAVRYLIRFETTTTKYGMQYLVLVEAFINKGTVFFKAVEVKIP